MFHLFFKSLKFQVTYKSLGRNKRKISLIKLVRKKLEGKYIFMSSLWSIKENEKFRNCTSLSIITKNIIKILLLLSLLSGLMLFPS